MVSVVKGEACWRARGGHKAVMATATALVWSTNMAGMGGVEHLGAQEKRDRAKKGRRKRLEHSLIFLPVSGRSGSEILFWTAGNQMQYLFKPIFITVCPKEECSSWFCTDNAYRSVPGLRCLRNSADKPRATKNSAGPAHHVCRLAQRLCRLRF